MTAPTPTIAVPDLLTVDVAVGGRALIVSDLHLEPDPEPPTVTGVTELVAAIEAWSGPGVIVFNGNLTSTQADPEQAARRIKAALGGHGRLVAAVRAFGAGPGRRVVALAGDHDACLAWDPAAQKEVTGALGAELAIAADLNIETGGGRRTVRVEPGHRLDPLAAFSDPRNPGESPFAQHLRTEVLPSVVDRAGTGRRASWLAGIGHLDDPAVYSRFVASRLAYRKLARRAWLLLIPVAVLIALRAPAVAVARTRGLTHAGARVAVLAGAGAIELAVLVLLVVVSVRSAWQALSAVSLHADRDDPNDAPRALARDLVTAGGHAGLVTGHTCRPELTNLGAGFYANTGCGAEVVAEVDARLPGLGLPSVFLAHRQMAWVELEAGAELHVRLLHARADLSGATVLERLMARRGPDDASGGELRPEVVAVFPHGASWPAAPRVLSRQRLVRRVAALVVAIAGFVSLVSTLSDPLRDRLHDVQRVFPLVVPETAAALGALAGLALLLVARGIRRGQRRAWVVCELLLLASALLHLLKGVDVEEAAIALAVAGFLWINRSSFRASADVPPARRSVVVLGTAAVVSVVAGALGVELSTWITAIGRPHHRFHISWAGAFQATVERMVGVRNVALPHRLDEFLTPALVAITVGLLLAAVALTFRPVVVRARERGRRVASPGGSADLERARAIMARHGSGTLDYFALRPDKDFFFWGDTLVAYAVYGGVCLVSPDPVGPVPEREEAWRAFRAFVDRQGWALGGLGIGEEWLPLYRATGMHDLYVGDEAVVRCERFTLEGGRFKGLRQAVNRVAKYGYTITFHDPSHLDPDLQAAVSEVMTKSRRGDVERGFSMTLGRVFEPDDAGLLLAVVHGPPPDGALPGTAGPPVAFCQYVPAPGIGGYSLDLMRRDDGDHPNGLIDFAVVETIRHLQANGGGGLGLNFATMRAVLAGEAGEGVTTRVQSWLLRRMGDSMQIESLWKFNAKFDPDWQPRYAIYDAPENALATALAVARAESFWELPVIGRFLVPSPGRPAVGDAQPASAPDQVTVGSSAADGAGAERSAR